MPRIILKNRSENMLAYEGKEPYVFVSYSHADTEEVIPLIRMLKQRMCRTWYDEGLTPGESWNDSIAEHLLKCAQLIVFISPTSVVSKYVLSEINYALSKNKCIIPVILKKTDIPLGLDMMLSSIQYLDISAFNDLTRSADAIASVLPKSVFASATMPFLHDLGYSFYMVSQEVERQETDAKNACTMICKDAQGNETEIFSLKRTGAYDVSYRLSSIDTIKDYFYPGIIRGSYQMNIRGSFCLEYPLYGPDVDVLLILILRIPRHGMPTVKLVDYQYVSSVSSLNKPDEEDLDVVGQKGWSTQIKNYLEGKLYH